MILNLKRYISLLLVLMLLIGIVPTVHAEGPDAEDIVESSEQTEALEDDGSALSPAPMALSAAGDYAVMSIASTQNSIMLFDYADNGNYTTVLNSQVACAYKPNGSGTTRTAYIKNLGWHFARYGGVAYPDDPLYCIEPWRSYGASTSGNSVDRGVTLDGSGSTTGSNVWYALPATRREAIGLILLYSNQMWDKSVSVTTTKKDSNPNVPLRIATQFLIYEIVCGLRNPTTFESNSTNECGTSGDIFYNAGEASVPYFAPKYNALVDTIQAAKKIPSFTASSSGSAPTITLDGEETSVTDSNGVLSNFSFTDGNGAEFYKSGNTLYITQTGDISESTVFKATRNLPSAASSTFNIWYMSGSTYQTTVSLANASTGSLNAYFKLKAVPQVGNISLIKTTEDGQNLSGWRFGIYSNSACTNLVSGPYSTNSSGKISVTDLTAGTYYVKELGHTDSAINAMYYCSSTNPQKVTVTANATTAVRFTNKLNTGSISLTKTTEDCKNLSGRQFGIYSDSTCTTLVSGPHSTDTSGKISVTGLTAGTYYVKELGNTDSAVNALYYCSSANPQAVTVTAGSTTAVSFANKLNTGGVKLVKETNTGKNLDGWKIGLYTDSSCTNAVSGSPFTTGTDGRTMLGGIMAKLYVAYGSNLNKNQMRGRCPESEFVGTGVVENYELQFKGSLHGAHATIAPKEGSFVPVGVWKIQKRDESRLDLYEGYNLKGYCYYNKEQIPVKMDDGSSLDGMEKMRSAFARDIFSQELLFTYQQQTEYRDRLREQGRESISEIVAQINAEAYQNPRIEELLLQLADRLSRTTGKKVYGYLKADVKAIVDQIVAELAGDENIQKLYDLWYEQREDVLRTYTDTFPERIRLEQNKEFKSIRNAVIQEALKLILICIKNKTISIPVR